MADRSDVEHGATTDGRIKHVEVRLVDAVTGAPSPPGEAGEILLRGPQQMLGYLRSEDNVDAFDADGYFRTGDLGRIADENYLVITGRKKDLIIRLGENLSPKEIEDALYTHPAIAVAAVVGMPNRRTGEAVCAFVVLHEGKTIDLPGIDRHLTALGLSRRKVPEWLEILPQMPVSPQVRRGRYKETCYERWPRSSRRPSRPDRAQECAPLRTNWTDAARSALQVVA